MSEGSTATEVSEKPAVSPQSQETAEFGRKEALVKEIGDFYQVPDQARKRALASEVMVLSPTEFDQQTEAHLRGLLAETGLNVETKPLDEGNELDTMLTEALGTSVAEENTRRLERNTRNAQIIKDTVVNEGGVTIPIDETKSKIIIKEGTELDRKMVEIHELIHAMASRGPKNGGGFRDGSGMGRNLDEAATQILTLGILHPELNPGQMYEKIRDGEIKTPYKNQVIKLLVGLHATSTNIKPIGIKDIAQYYFHEEGDIQGIFLQMKIAEKAPDTVKEKVVGLFENDLQEKNI